jgi:hypothetical protein
VVAGHRLMVESIRPHAGGHSAPHDAAGAAPDDLPFELDVLEAALHVSISKLDTELLHTQDLVQGCLLRLPRDITPRNLDELRKAKGALVELESKSDALRCATEILPPFCCVCMCAVHTHFRSCSIVSVIARWRVGGVPA